MKLVIERDAFIKSLAKIQGIVEKRNAMPILSNALIRVSDNNLEVIATDLEVTVMDKCPVDMHTEGALTINAKKLFDIIRELPEGPVSLTSDDEYHVEVKSGKNKTELMGLSTDDYPKIPDPSEFQFVDIPAAAWAEMVEKTIYATAGEEARFSLNGIYAEKTEDGKSLRMVSTDGHRLALIERELEKASDLSLESGIILPRKGMSEVVKIVGEKEGTVGLALKEKQAAVKFEDTVLIMRLVDGKFPDYRRVIIEGCDKTAMINSQELLKNLRRVSIMVDEKARAVKFTFSGNVLALESKNPNFGSSYSELEIEYEGDEVKIGFNDRYFADIIGAAKTDKIKVELKDEQSPALVSVEEDPNYTCVIMPMRL